MAYSMMSTTNQKRKCVSSRIEIDSPFESSDWINLDLDDFIGENGYDVEDSSIFSSFETSSYAASDFLLHENNRENLMSKKRKTMEAAYMDQELEDTASSPVQSPKVNHLNLFYMKSKERRSSDIGQENGHIFSPPAGDSANTSTLDSELRKKGLCLIPTSMFLNYLSASALV